MKQTYSDFVRSICKTYGVNEGAAVSYQDEACSACGAMIHGWHAGRGFACIFDAVQTAVSNGECP